MYLCSVCYDDNCVLEMSECVRKLSSLEHVPLLKKREVIANLRNSSGVFPRRQWWCRTAPGNSFLLVYYWKVIYWNDNHIFIILFSNLHHKSVRTHTTHIHIYNPFWWSDTLTTDQILTPSAHFIHNSQSERWNIGEYQCF